MYQTEEVEVGTAAFAYQRWTTLQRRKCGRGRVCSDFFTFQTVRHHDQQCDLSSKRMAPAEAPKQQLANDTTILHAV